ncbi:MAG: hypothetical protein WCK13_10575 [Ignavibacteriota bacterium]
MNKFVLLFSLFALFFIVNSVKSQTLYFCEGVDDDGNPIGTSSTFSIPFEGGYFYALVKLPVATDCREVYYDIYDVKGSAENYNTTLTQSGLSNKWDWFWKKLSFDYAGSYHIKVNDCNGKELVDGYVKVKYN